MSSTDGPVVPASTARSSSLPPTVSFAWLSAKSRLPYPSSTGRLRVDPREAFLLAEEGQHIENSRRGGLPGQRRAKRLRQLAETKPLLLCVGFEIGFQRAGCPVLL